MTSGKMFTPVAVATVMALERREPPARSIANATVRRMATARGARAREAAQPQPSDAVSHGRPDSRRRWTAGAEAFTQAPRQAQPEVRRDDRSRSFDNRGADNRRFDNGSFDNRRFDNRGLDNRRFSAPIVRGRSYSPRIIVPRIYRPGFSLGFGLFFGRPLPYRYSYPAYGYGYGRPAVAYGAISFQLNPGNAGVYVDGNYMGQAIDFCDSTRPLSLTAGTHRIELEADGYEPVAFDVNVVPGELLPYQGSLQPAY